MTSHQETPALTWDEVSRVVNAAPRVLLYGPPGTGKSWAAQHGPGKVYALTLTPDTPAAELRGHYIPQGPRFIWQDGPALTAWRQGATLVINEIGLAGPDVLAILYALADAPDVACLTLPTGEIVRPAPGFRLVATTNEDPGILPPALLDRFPVRLHIRTCHPGAVDALPEDLRAAARDTVDAEDPDRRVPIRTWGAFASLRPALGPDLAARAVFGDRAGDVLDALAMAPAA